MLVEGVFYLFLILAAYIDFKERRIPNWLNGLATVVLPIVAFFYSSEDVLIDQMKGGFYVLTLFLVVYVISLWLRGSPEIGAGDLKMGFWFGWGVGYAQVPYVLLFSIILIFLVRLIIWFQKGACKAPLPYAPSLLLIIMMMHFSNLIYGG
ncbi:MAG: prepilin peptidase [Bacillaceae bacterium]|nr:prepilin peptidase [Bacillaceae bacterium]